MGAGPEITVLMKVKDKEEEITDQTEPKSMKPETETAPEMKDETKVTNHTNKPGKRDPLKSLGNH